MTTQELFTDTWTWNPVVLLVVASALTAYGRWTRFKLNKQTACFYTGIVLLFLILASPLTVLAHQYLFSAHMAQHMLLLLIVPPLLVLGIPEKTWKHMFWSFSGSIPPLVAWGVGVGTMWFWHIPAVFNSTMQHQGIAICGSGAWTVTASLHGLQTLSLLLAGAVFCWPVLSPFRSSRLAPLSGIAYLFTACMGCSLLGLSIAFSDTLLYTSYVAHIDLLNMAPLLRNQWGLTPATDQQIGGLLMWVPGCFIYASASLLLLMRWFDEEAYYPDAISEEIDLTVQTPYMVSQQVKK